jgi:hypothetical protein
MASVAHTIGMAQHRETMIVVSQPSGLDRKLRRELIDFSRCLVLPNVYRRRRSQGRKVCAIPRPKGQQGNVH